jgi:hypothetical protein
LGFGYSAFCISSRNKTQLIISFLSGWRLHKSNNCDPI